MSALPSAADVVPAYRQRVKAVVPVGTPKSAWVVASPFSHFQSSLSLASVLSFLIASRLFWAVRQPVRGAPTPQLPAPSHSSSVHGSPSAGQGEPLASSWQLDEQQSPLTRLPSSQVSPASTMLSPQVGTRTIWPRISPRGKAVEWMFT